MPRTVTGTYTLRPTSYNTYVSSGTFSNYFSTTPTNPSSWTTKMSMTTEIGDNSDSTYYSHTNVSTSQAARNAIMNLTLTDGSIPAIDYTVTKVSLKYRARGANQSDANRKLNLWFSIWDTTGGTTPTAAMNAGYFGMKVGYSSGSSLHTVESSITAKTYNISSFTNTGIAGSKFPNRMAICENAYRTSAWTSFAWWYLYDVWFEVSYEYTEEEVKSYVYTDNGVALSGDATIAPGSSTFGESYIEDYAGETKSLTATVQEGYDFDGWYLNGQKVSEELTYVLTIALGAQLYCIAKRRMVYVGPARVKEIYIGTTPVGEVYVGDEVIWGPSPLYGRATAVG